MQVLRCFVLWWVAGIALLATPSFLLAQQPTPAAASERVIAAVDVVLTHRVIEADGTPSTPISTESAFTLQKLRTKSGATRIRLKYRRPTPGPDALARSTPLDGAVVEYDPDQRATIVFDEDGRRLNPRLSLETASQAGLGTFESWLDSLALRSADGPKRRQALEQSHGRPAGRVGRFTRYVQLRGDLTEELLVDPASALPVEINVHRQNALETHTTIEYGSTPRGQLVRRRLRTEQLIDAGSGRRAVVSIDFSNVTAEGW